MGAYVTDPVGVCNFAAFGELRLADEKYGTGAGNVLAFRAGFSYFVGNKFITFVGVGSGPNVSCWNFKKPIRGGLFSCCFLGGVAKAEM